MDNDTGLAAQLGRYLQSLDEPKRKLFFACLDCVKAQPLQQDGPLPPDILEVPAFVMSHTQSVDKDTLARALETLNPAAPLGLGPGYPVPFPSSVRAHKKDAPLQGTPLLDGQAISWADRLKEKAVNAGNNSNTNNTGTLPLIRNYAEACQMFSEYASLEYKTVPDNNAADFPLDEAEQRALATLIYEAIIDMSDILERKSPISLKKANTSTTSSSSSSNSSSSNSSSRPAEPSEDAQALVPAASPASPARPVKDTISVSKVKGLSRIEVWLLSWMILFTTHDIHRGRLPFLHWSKTDWGWESNFATFRARLDAVIVTLRRSKAAVCSLLESDYKSRLEAHPIREYRRKENNRSQNAERNAQVFVGRHTISTGKVKRNDDGSLCDMEGNIVAPGDADHSGLIEQTLKLCQGGGRVAKTKRDSFECEDAGQPGQPGQSGQSGQSGQLDQDRKTPSKKRAKKARAETTVEQQPASTSEPDFDWNDDDLIRSLSGYRTSSPDVSASDMLGLVPSVEMHNDANIKSDEEADNGTLAAQLPTPSPEFMPSTERPSPAVQTKTEPAYPMTPEELPQNGSNGSNGPTLDTDNANSLSSINYAPGQHLGPTFDGIYHPYHPYIYGNPGLPASSPLYSMGFAGAVDALNAINPCGFLQPPAGFQPTASFGVAGTGAGAAVPADAFMYGMNDTYGPSSLLYNVAFPQGGLWGVDNAGPVQHMGADVAGMGDGNEAD